MENKTWPIDPNAPKGTLINLLSQGYKLVYSKARNKKNEGIMVIGGDFSGKSSCMHLAERLAMGMGAEVGFETNADKTMAIVIAAGSKLFLTDEEIIKLKGEAIRITPPIPITPLPELFEMEPKQLQNQKYIQEDNRNSSGYVSPREQKNRERFNKKGRK